MSYEVMLKNRQQEEEQALSTVIPYSSTSSVSPTFDPVEVVVTKRKKNGIRGVSSATDEQATKTRKKVVKNLPEKKIFSEKEMEKPKLIKQRRGRSEKSIDLQKYYQTELLTAKEEYSLGMQIHFMMKCEEVHEGLATKLMRLPTMEEWAHACGFMNPDPTFVQCEGDEQIRPAGSDNLFKEQDPDMFVGNGLATEAGPGRGRGRVKKAPSYKLGPYYDDSEQRFEKGPPLPGDNPRGRLVNKGTATDFVELMFTAREAKQRMVQSNMRLVVSIARKYSNVGVNLQDLVQEGSLGLTRAAEKFEPKKGFKFSTYASWWIQQAVFRSIAYHSRTIRLPVHIHNLLNRIRKIRMTLERDLGRMPTNDEMAKQLDMSTEKYNKMIRLTRRSISLELPKYSQNPKDLGHESDDLLGESISTTSSVLDESDPEKRVDRGLFHEDLREMLTILEEDERRVICARYGLSDGLTRTVTTVAAQMKQTKAWVRSQECRALRKLRRPWYEQRLKEHQDALTN
jgi:RNA polymerase sigma factor (sigma-70 family)